MEVPSEIISSINKGAGVMIAMHQFIENTESSMKYTEHVARGTISTQERIIRSRLFEKCVRKRYGDVLKKDTEKAVHHSEEEAKQLIETLHYSHYDELDQLRKRSAEDKAILLKSIEEKE